MEEPVLQNKKKHISVVFWKKYDPDFEMNANSPERTFPYCRNSVLSILLFGLVLFNLVFLFRGLLSIPHHSIGNKICQSYSMTMDQEDSRDSVVSKVIDVVFFGKFAYRNMKIARGIDRTVSSILKNTKSPIRLHVLLDLPSKKRISRALKKISLQFHRRMNVTYYDVEEIAENNQPIIETMKRYFFYKDVGRYNDDIFFMSEIFHLIFPESLTKIIFLDLDLKFVADIKELYDEFNKFSSSNIIGIGPDLQPQYRVDFSKFRAKNPGTSVGSHRPGMQGFNTGVTLFHLKRMRESGLYQSLLNDTVLESLCDKYQFKGYLGHQDFFTLTGMEYPELYYNLDCSWNRQLDTGWLNHSGKDVFDLYHDCDSQVKIYHGNGNANIPEE